MAASSASCRGTTFGDKKIKELNIRHSVVKRLVKELQFYRKEEILNKQKIETIKADRQHVSSSGEDMTGEVKRYTAVLNDTQQMLPDAQKRLASGCVELRKAMEIAGNHGDTQEIVEEARLTLNSAAEECPEITAQLDRASAAKEAPDKQNAAVVRVNNDGRREQEEEEECI
eukprot:GHVS01002810.1.p1 GENE.GHVS01002810.1~~GHVS01002810.1.p1  ORF type:complete len:172 (-),score=43.63 GHVS01002810.1:232-747(-)